VRKSGRNRGGQVAAAELPTPTPKKNNRSQSQSGQVNNSDENIYDKGEYVAFIDAADSLEKFKIAHVSLE
jgi:hypothetical protein